ncbi:MAG: hypothetical protein SVV80_12055, partial [Planctomycetota bacterium]|nr:hypothetical protein [Planctomycetota bacterium]
KKSAPSGRSWVSETSRTPHPGLEIMCALESPGLPAWAKNDRPIMGLNTYSAGRPACPKWYYAQFARKGGASAEKIKAGHRRSLSAFGGLDPAYMAARKKRGQACPPYALTISPIAVPAMGKQVVSRFMRWFFYGCLSTGAGGFGIVMT